MKKKTLTKTSISHYWDGEVLAWLKKESKRLDRSVSWVLNNLVRQAMDNENEK